MRVRYSGPVPTALPGVEGVWTPGEVRDVSADVATRLVHNRWFLPDLLPTPDLDPAPQDADPPAKEDASADRITDGISQ